MEYFDGPLPAGSVYSFQIERTLQIDEKESAKRERRHFYSGHRLAHGRTQKSNFCRPDDLRRSGILEKRWSGAQLSQPSWPSKIHDYRRVTNAAVDKIWPKPKGPLFGDRSKDNAIPNGNINDRLYKTSLNNVQQAGKCRSILFGSRATIEKLSVEKQ
ncbi:hypothetical protein T4B_14250 [Trichinella pseudospiralis]|uniref:Uncharacterized protein n=1 Tax=Trichinella pseudospiralis TaxID=6337 RepID=A0A0V0Y278_TRIPS|nr:hypothetical protein T4E_9071 [Trichinella pseudospiralis]KRZ20312.1 hypothetical protein T4B_14250 [Trichinella pseudospiralis]KRZ43209.1 hypothetical protein T4C_8287 [Trichinella pseudospiralis]